MSDHLTYAGVAIFGKGKAVEDIHFRSSTTSNKTEPLQAFIALPDTDHISSVTHKMVKLPHKMAKQDAMRYLLDDTRGFLTPAISEFLKARIRAQRNGSGRTNGRTNGRTKHAA